MKKFCSSIIIAFLFSGPLSFSLEASEIIKEEEITTGKTVMMRPADCISFEVKMDTNIEKIFERIKNDYNEGKFLPLVFHPGVLLTDKEPSVESHINFSKPQITFSNTHTESLKGSIIFSYADYILKISRGYFNAPIGSVVLSGKYIDMQEAFFNVSEKVTLLFGKKTVDIYPSDEPCENGYNLYIAVLSANVSGNIIDINYSDLPAYIVTGARKIVYS